MKFGLGVVSCVSSLKGWVGNRMCGWRVLFVC